MFLVYASGRRSLSDPRLRLQRSAPRFQAHDGNVRAGAHTVAARDIELAERRCRLAVADIRVQRVRSRIESANCDRKRLPSTHPELLRHQGRLPATASASPGIRSPLPGARSALPGARSTLPGARSTLPGGRTESLVAQTNPPEPPRAIPSRSSRARPPRAAQEAIFNPCASRRHRAARAPIGRHGGPNVSYGQSDLADDR